MFTQLSLKIPRRDWSAKVEYVLHVFCNLYSKQNVAVGKKTLREDLDDETGVKTGVK